MAFRSLPLVFVACSLTVTACRKPEITSYRVPKETTTAAAAPASAVPATNTPPPAAPTPAPAPSSAMAQTAVPTGQNAPLTWTAPKHWQTKAASAMRKGSYAIASDGSEADVSVTSFPGDVGGDLANLNRWRGQVKLAPIAQTEFEANTQHLDRNDLHMTVVDLLGTGTSGKPERILGAIVPHGGNTWFFKMQGPDALVAKEKSAFMALLDTVKPAPAAR